MFARLMCSTFYIPGTEKVICKTPVTNDNRTLGAGDKDLGNMTWEVKAAANTQLGLFVYCLDF